METVTNSYSIGSKGPGWGIVFHVDCKGGQGLEARQAEEDTAMAWANAADYVAAIVRRFGPGWRLPTIKELQLLYQQRDVVGGFDHDFHWSSTEVNSDSALSLVNSTGNLYPLRKKGDACYVRAVRIFDLNAPIRSEAEETHFRVEPDERVIWSDTWKYNYEKTFSQGEKDEIMMGVKTQTLTPDTNIASGYRWENNKVSVYIYWSNGVWKINGAKRKPKRKWWHFWEKAGE